MTSVQQVGVGDGTAGLDRPGFFAIMSAFPTGVTIVAALDAEGLPRGLTANAVCSVSADPPLLLVCVDRNSQTLPALRHSRRFVVNFLTAGRADLSDRFAGKDSAKFDGLAWRPASNGMPWLHEDTIAHAVCTITDEVDAGDHLIFIGLVEDGEPPQADSQPLMYFRRTYGTWPLPGNEASDGHAGAQPPSDAGNRPSDTDGDGPGHNVF